MRTNFLPRSYYRGAAEQASTAAADVSAATPESCSSHVLHQAPRTDAVNNTSRSPRAMLASARKSLASLRKRLPSMCLGSPTTEATQTPGKASTPHASVQTPPRPQMAQAGLDAPAPDAMGEPFYLNPLRHHGIRHRWCLHVLESPCRCGQAATKRDGNSNNLPINAMQPPRRRGKWNLPALQGACRFANTNKTAAVTGDSRRRTAS